MLAAAELEASATDAAAAAEAEDAAAVAAAAAACEPSTECMRCTACAASGCQTGWPLQSQSRRRAQCCGRRLRGCTNGLSIVTSRQHTRRRDTPRTPQP